MARVALTVAVAACMVALAAAAIPTFPDNWQSDQISHVAINQGGVKQPDGTVCCPADAPECKVQTIFQAGIQYVWYTGNMSAFLSPGGGGIVTDFNAQKQYEVNATGYCQEYCPLGGVTMSTGIVPSNAKSMGVVSYNGRQLNLYMTTTQIPVLNITMQTTSYYIDQSSTPAVPVAILQNLEPFGQHMGGQNQTFVTFTPGVPAKSNFNVIGAASCPMAKGCNGGGGGDDDGGDVFMMNVRRLMADGATPTPEASISRTLKGAPAKIDISF